MDTNENLQQINTFTGGMDTDTSDMHVQPNTYRMARNLRLGLADDGKTGELKKIYGTKLEKFYDEDGNDLQIERVVNVNAYKNVGILICSEEKENVILQPQQKFDFNFKKDQTQQFGGIYLYIHHYDHYQQEYRDFEFTVTINLTISYIYNQQQLTKQVEISNWTIDNSFFGDDDTIQLDVTKDLLFFGEYVTDDTLFEIDENEEFVSTTITNIVSIDSISFSIPANSQYEYTFTTSFENVQLYKNNENFKLPEIEYYTTWSIYRFNTATNYCKLIFGPCKDLLDFDNVNTYFVEQASGTVEVEGEEISKKLLLYINDGKNREMSMYVLDPDLEEYGEIQTTVDSIYNRDKYVLLPPKIYVRYDGLSRITNGTFQYFYILYDDNDNYSNISFFSKQIVIPYNNHCITNIEIDAIPGCRFNAIKIYKIVYDVEQDGNGNQQTTYKIYEIIDNQLYNPEQKYIVTDSSDLSNLTPIQDETIEDRLNSVYVYNASEVCYTGQSVQKFIGNVSDEQTAVEYDFEDIDTRSFSQGSYYVGENGEKVKILDDDGNIENAPSQTDDVYNPTFDILLNPNHVFERRFWTKRKNGSFGGVGKYFSWTFESLILDEDRLDFYDYLRRNGQYDRGLDTDPWIINYNDINYRMEWKTRYADYLKTTTYNKHDKVYKPGEIYRFGAILYSIENVPSSVKWIADIQIPDEGKPVGIKFKLNKKIPKCSYIQIVRCKRTLDKDTVQISNGVIFPVYNSPDNMYCGVSGPCNNDPSQGTLYHSSDKFLFYSPELSFSPEIIDIYDSLVRQLIAKKALYFKTDVSYQTGGNNGSIFPDTTYDGDDLCVYQCSFTKEPQSHIKEILRVDRAVKIEPKSGTAMKTEDNKINLSEGSAVTTFGPQLFMNFGHLKYAGNTNITTSGSHWRIFSTGKSELIHLEKEATFFNPLYSTIDPLTMQYKPNGIGGIVYTARMIQNCNPYGGYNIQAIKQSQYYQIGEFLYNTRDAEISLINSGDSKIFDDFIQLFHAAKNDLVLDIKTGALFNKYRCFADADIDGNDYNLTNYRLYQQAVDGYQCPYKDLHGNRQVYNQSGTPQDIKLRFLAKSGAVPNMSIQLDKYDGAQKPFRILYGDITDEQTDIFKSNDYIDLDPKYGEITKLKQYKNRLYFWQTSAFGYISLNEKPLQDTSAQYEQNSAISILLGTGDLLKQPLYISTKVGMNKNNKIICETKKYMYWYSDSVNDIARYSIEDGIRLLSAPCNIKQYFIKNSENTKDKQYAIYRGEYDEVLFNFSNDESLVYNEQLEKFTGVYDYVIQGFAITPSKTLLYNSEYIYQDNVRGSNTIYGNPFDIYLDFIINNKQQFVKTYNNIQLSLNTQFDTKIKDDFTLVFKTPLNQISELKRENITDRELDYRAAIPRAGKYDEDGKKFVTAKYGDRMRGKTMEVELHSNSENFNVSIQYIITKYSISWS